MPTASEGRSSSFIEFNIGTPVDRAVNDVRDAISQIRGDLPDGILEPFIEKETTSSNPIAYFAVAAPDLTIEQLSWFVDNTVAKELLSVPGLAAVDRTGGVSREIRVILDPAKLQSLGITASQVNQQLRAMNVNAAGGRAEIAGSEQSVRVLGSAITARELGETQISLGGGRTIRLSAVASVRDQWAEQTSFGIQNGRQVVSFMIQKAKGYSDVSVYHAVQEELRALEAEGVAVSARVSHELPANPHNTRYLATKRVKLGHLL